MGPIETCLAILGLASNAHSLFTGFKTGKQMQQVIRELEKTKSELQRLSHQILYAPSIQEVRNITRNTQERLEDGYQVRHILGLYSRV